jgi:hypothetical protein
MRRKQIMGWNGAVKEMSEFEIELRAKIKIYDALFDITISELCSRPQFHATFEQKFLARIAGYRQALPDSFGVLIERERERLVHEFLERLLANLKA